MSGTTARPGLSGETAALSVHGPGGVLDLTVPTAVTIADVARAYAADAGGGVPELVSRTGRRLAPERTLSELGLHAGAVLVAVGPQASAAGAGAARRTSDPGRAPAYPATGLAAWMAGAVVLAALAAWAGLQRPADERWVVVGLLGAAALVGCLPVGAAAGRRVLTAPAFAAAACLLVVWDPTPERLPTVLGAAALAAAVTAALGRAWSDPADGADEGLWVWIVVGAGWFVVAVLGAIAGVEAQVVWAVLLLAAVLAARIVPTVAIDVPDEYLIDLERLAVNAWSARDRTPGKRGRVVVPTATVGAIAARGARSINAAGVAILVVTVVSAPLLLATADIHLDQIGARCLVGFGGATLLLVARTYRHRLARTALRLAGLGCLLLLVGVALTTWEGDRLVAVTLSVVLGGVGLAVLAVAVGRGWRSPWWSRRAEVGEVLFGSFAIASLVVAVGLFRSLWELTG
ncbi:ubiquitin family protein [Nocardioides sambongensis]|uniref:hypothetical protein n=1 Tax=Nocardioides sambongensis TaxID=2589074 RepID=UPI001125C3A7|nr:hypothetical protein [Nocardioides sambongensis]